MNVERNRCEARHSMGCARANGTAAQEILDVFAQLRGRTVSILGLGPHRLAQDGVVELEARRGLAKTMEIARQERPELTTPQPRR